MQIPPIIRDMAGRISQVVGVNKTNRIEAKSLQAKADLWLLREDHRSISKTLEELSSSTAMPPFAKANLLQIAIKKFHLHSTIEEKFFYPHFRVVDPKLASEAQEDHRTIRLLINRISISDSSEDELGARISALKRLIEKLIEREEHEIFPKCRNLMTVDLLKEIESNIREYLDYGIDPRSIIH
jgi:hemerythrin-like domain-containing protein